MSETMSKVDNFWLCMDDPTNLMVITGFMEFGESLDYDVLTKNIEKRLLIFERFKQRVVPPISGVGLSSWEEDPTFDLKSHIHRIALPAPGDKTVFQNVASDIVAVPLDPTKPLWHIYLIENYGKDGKGCALFYRIHHCIADGIALIYVLLSMTDTTKDASLPQPQAHETDEKVRKTLLQSLKKTMSGKLRSTQKLGTKVFKEFTKTMTDPSRLKEFTKTATHLTTDVSSVLTKIALMPPEPKTVFKGTLKIRKCVAWTDPIPLGDVKTVGKIVQATLNDVLIATVTGALRRYLTKHNDNVNSIDIRVAIPVNIRKPGTEFEMGNKFSLVLLSLPVHISDPVLRLKEVKRRMDELKRSADAMVGFMILSSLGMVPPNIAQKSAGLLASRISAVMTNVPGPRQPLYFAGSKIDNMMFWVPRSGNIGMGISILSYDGKVTVGLSTDENIVADPEAILEGFEKDFNYLYDLVKTGKVFPKPLVLNDRYQEVADDIFTPTEETLSIIPNWATNNTATLGTAPSEAERAPTPKQKVRCKATTKSGTPCKNSALEGSEFCKTHKSIAQSN